ncbi:TIGR03086 family metal-binding protein [Streptomyces sp. NPDC093085]|uniref:TIGR03086 family metal-binding protein n=1 Tax=Streptomyces sp. NPDC093085 TaxID=3155068 RepID=UPI00344247D6
MNDTNAHDTNARDTNPHDTSVSRISELLAVVAERALPVVQGVGDDQLGAPTPCAAYDVHALLDHLFQVVVNFQALAAKRDADFGAPPEHLAGEWRERFAVETARLIAAWEAPGAEEGTAGALGLPARTVGSMVLGDLALHAWDLARATGQPYEPAAAVVETLAEGWAALAPMGREAGVFGEPVAVAADAPPFDALLGLTGRDPEWAPGRGAGGGAGGGAGRP